MERTNRVRRIAQRIGFHVPRALINQVARFNHRIYMRLYNALLRRYGMKLNGEPRYIATTAYFDDMCNITLGDRVVISTDVSFLTHDYSITIALRSIGEEPPTDIAMVRGITVGDNVFIGRSCLVMPNTTIGNHVIVAAGSVVRGRIPDYSIVMGNPAAVVGHIRDKARKWQDLDKAQMRQD